MGGGGGVVPVWVQVALSMVAVAVLVWLLWAQLSDRDH